MRASRLLRILLLLQNRGRLTAGRLAEELEVSRRTILRDVDAMTEAGLPVVVTHGAGGGIGLGFDYRTRLTGLDAAEAQAMGVILSHLPAALADLGLAEAGALAAAKLWETFPDLTGARMAQARTWFQPGDTVTAPDPRRAALALAVREGRVARLQAQGPAPVVVHPLALVLHPQGWHLIDARGGPGHPEADWGDVNISARRFGIGQVQPNTKGAVVTA